MFRFTPASKIDLFSAYKFIRRRIKRMRIKRLIRRSSVTIRPRRKS